MGVQHRDILDAQTGFPWSEDFFLLVGLHLTALRFVSTRGRYDYNLRAAASRAIDESLHAFR